VSEFSYPSSDSLN